MGTMTKTRALMIAAVVAATASMPMSALADGHTNAYPGNKGYVGEPRPVTQQHYHGGKYRGNSRARGYVKTADANAAVCPPKFYGQFRGTLYCQNGVLLR